ncbi:MAG: hypothetical protein C0622_00425 [Desulfuromonas sp.]|nr:MAG: hypothetical protein C0622_00425 [Desulfuromonas sp.]
MEHPPETQRDEGYKYEWIKQSIGDAIDSGALSAGDRVPSLRVMSRKSQLSITTVMRAYLDLEQEGRIESRPQSGFYVRRKQRELAAPRTSNPDLKPTRLDSLDFHFEIMNAMVDTAIVPLGAATPAAELLPLAELTKRLRQVGALHKDAYGYEELVGNRKLRAQIAYHMLETGMNVHMDDIIITNGASEALYLALAVLAGPGSTVAVESPCYFGYLHILETLGIATLEIPTDPETGVDIDALEQAFDLYDVKACILQPNYNNPFGSLTPDAKKQRLADLFAARGVTLIEDDIVGDLPFAGPRPRTIASFKPELEAIYISSFSKTLSPGLRIGWIYSKALHSDLHRRKMAISMNTNRPAQLALADYLAGGRYAKHLKNYRAHCRRQVNQIAAAVEKFFPEKTRLSDPKGGFLLWTVLPERIDSDRLYRAALAEGIGIAPGSIFTSQNRYRNCIRLSCGHPYSASIEAALKRLGELATASVGD